MMTLGFGVLYFFHEIALPHGKVNDTVFQGLLGFFSIFLAFSLYGLFGSHRFDKALRALKGITFEQIKEREITLGFENLLKFTFSSYFLPQRGCRMRNIVIREYAEYLHSIGKDDPAALRVYLKAFLQNPKDSRFRIPLLSVLKQVKNLKSAEIDLLLVMLKTEAGEDKIIASHLSSLFLVQKLFNRKTEPVFLAAIGHAHENTDKVLKFVLPLLLAKNRSDEYAIKFYLRALVFHPSQEKRLREIIGESFCHGYWEAISPELHQEIGRVFNELDTGQQKIIQLKVAKGYISEKWKKLRLFSGEDIKVLQGLKLEHGVLKSTFAFMIDGFYWLTRSIILIAKTMIMRALDALIWFKESSLVLKFSSLVLAVLLILGGVGALKVQQGKALSSAKVVPDDSWVGMKVPSKESSVNKVHTIQVAAVTYKGKADQIVKKLQDKGVVGLYIIKTKRPVGGYWYKIRLEKFSEKKDAQRFADQMINRGIIKNYFIITYVPQLP